MGQIGVQRSWAAEVAFPQIALNEQNMGVIREFENDQS